ncbi:hemerythrin domain-containing protein [Nonomuraea sp. NN258]|uniref:hemerythrin domain-containing protein n=1 Tax=Nonomuraea antri TaxID=2730852 RepID=UPI001569069E|nr:hemerythrin domain-containing protein [Nonomuraea antri]NRQ36063.1 hemerythrin domain-containing protein [Nonomuraea antri]
MGKVKQEGDVVDLILQQHTQIRQLFSQAEQAEGKKLAKIFSELALLLEVHEEAEEKVVHPVAKAIASDVAEARVREENEAKKVLKRLKDMGPDADGFGELFQQLKEAVDAHATHEERDEFPRLREQCDESELRDMAEKFAQFQALKGGQRRPM